MGRHFPRFSPFSSTSASMFEFSELPFARVAYNSNLIFRITRVYSTALTFLDGSPLKFPYITRKFKSELYTTRACGCGSSINSNFEADVLERARAGKNDHLHLKHLLHRQNSVIRLNVNQNA